MLSESTENYLTAILRMEEAEGSAGTSALAQYLDVAPASVTGMLKKLARRGLVTHRLYRGSHLTRRGRTAALRVIRRHRLVETFLARVLGLAPERVHEEAHRWEHALSDDVVDRLDAWLGHPSRDPHGTPIPTATRHATTDRAAPSDIAVHRRLTQLEPGESGRVVTVVGSVAGHTRYLRELGFKAGARVNVVKRQPYDGPFSLIVAGRRCIVGTEVTEYVIVSEEDADS